MREGLYVRTFAKAGRHHYLAWLEGYLAAGNKPTRIIGDPFPGGLHFAWARQDFTLRRRRVASTLHWPAGIIVPAGIECADVNLGTTILYLMDGHQPKASSYIPYNQVPLFMEFEFITLPGMDDFIAEQDELNRQKPPCGHCGSNAH